MTIKIRDFDPTTDKRGKVKGTLTMPHDGTVIDCIFQTADDIPKVQAAIDREWADSQAKFETQRKRHIDEMNAQIAAKDAQIAAINREIEDTRAKIKAQEAEIIRAGDELAATRDAAKRVLPSINTDGMNARQIRIAVIKSQSGDTAVDGKSDDYIAARFDFIADAVPVKRDRFAVAVAGGIQTQDARSASDKAYDEMVARLTNAHKPPSGDGAA